MSEERLLILRMLENGKITSEEAERLLRALGGAESGKTGARLDWNRFSPLDFGTSWQDAARGVREVGKQMSEKIARELQQVLESLAALPEWFGRWEIGGVTVEQVYRVPRPLTQLEIRTLHGNVRIVAEDRDDVEVHVRAQVGESADSEEGNPLDRCWSLHDGAAAFVVDEETKTVRGAHVVARVPREMMERLAVRQTNGRIRVERVEVRFLELSVTNGTVELEHVASHPGGKVEVRVTNGRIFWSLPRGVALDGTIKTGIGVADIRVPGRLSDGGRIVRRRGEAVLRAPQG
ncbi:MAG: hypothetical protein IRY98_13260, partial [Alicyclobacillaceae bacterium]|nr:hypothetical protein [Alicyclobacillaceae bacterium]